MPLDALLQYLLPYLPALARVGGIVGCAPLLGSAVVPRRVRALIAVALTMGLLPSLAPTPTQQTPLGGFALSIVSEALIGIAIGGAMNLIFVAAQWSGELIAQQMGLSLAESFDPTMQSHGTVLGGGFSLLTMVVFLGINGHHALIRGIQSSFQSLPVSTAVNGASIIDMFARLLTAACAFAIQLAAPVCITLLICDLALGMVGRTVPQVGLMTAGITVRAVVGLLVLVLCAALTTALLQSASINWMQVVTSAIPSLSGQ